MFVKPSRFLISSSVAGVAAATVFGISNLSWSRIPGIDGKGLADPSVDFTDPSFTVESKLRKDLDGLEGLFKPKRATWGMLGCALSHKRAWELCASKGRENNDAILLILEDDAHLPKDFGQRVQAVVQRAKIIDPEWDLLYFGFNADASLQGSFQGGPGLDFKIRWNPPLLNRSLGHGEHFPINWAENWPIDDFLLYRPKKIFGLCGYAVKPAGAKKLIDSCFPLQLLNESAQTETKEKELSSTNSPSFHIDDIMALQIRQKKIRALGILPPIIMSNNCHADSDTVGPEA
eukprot:UC4_evm8s135